MIPFAPSFSARRSLARVVLLAAFPLSSVSFAAAVNASPTATSPIQIEQRDPWTAADLIEPQALAKSLAGPAAERPAVYCVGFSMLYAGGHIPGAPYAGPASDADGLRRLKATVQSLPRDKPIVIYCGCCPWDHCPNIRPAFRALHAMGFRHIRVLVIPSNFHDDWTAKGLPVARGPAAS